MASTPTRPLPITIIGWLFVFVGCGSLVRGAWQFLGTTAISDHDLVDLALVTISGTMAAVGGAFVLRGRGWARWLLIVWMGLHVILSLAHSRVELAVHTVFFVILFLVFSRKAELGTLR